MNGVNVENKLNPGAIQITNTGKTRMYTKEGWVDFGVMYVAQDIRKICRNQPFHKYLDICAICLENNGLFGIKEVQDKLKRYLQKAHSIFGKDAKIMSLNCRIWYRWLQQIQSFRNFNRRKDTPIIKVANENFRKNYGSISFGIINKEVIATPLKETSEPVNEAKENTPIREPLEVLA